MGGNLVLKMAGELGEAAPPPLRGVCAVCPSLDLAACADTIALPRNFPYERRFMHSLKQRLRRKALLFPGQYRSEEHTSELQSQSNLVCRLLLEKKKKKRCK